MDMGFGGSQIWKRAAGHSRYGIISCPQIDRTDWSRAVDRKLAVPEKLGGGGPHIPHRHRFLPRCHGADPTSPAW